MERRRINIEKVSPGKISVELMSRIYNKGLLFLSVDGEARDAACNLPQCHLPQKRTKIFSRTIVTYSTGRKNVFECAAKRQNNGDLQLIILIQGFYHFLFVCLVLGPPLSYNKK